MSFKIFILGTIILGIFTIICAIYAIRCLIKELSPKSGILSIIISVCSLIVTLLASFQIKVPSPIILPLDNENQIFKNHVEISITSEEKWCKVYYSLDGSDPKKDGIKYNGSFSVLDTTTICARSKFFIWWSDISKSSYNFDDEEVQPNISGYQSQIITGNNNEVVQYNYNHYNSGSDTIIVPIPETDSIEPLTEFPFSVNRNMIFSETQNITIPESAYEGESGTFTLSIPVNIQKREYQSDKVPLNDDIHGFIVNDIYYCNDDPPQFDIDDEYCLTDTRNEIDLHNFNYYDFGDYWLCLHRVDVCFIGSDNFSPDLEGADIILREKKSQKAVIVENNYSGDYVTFECSTGDYVIEIRKNNIAYVQDISVKENIEKRILVISKKDYKRLQ